MNRARTLAQRALDAGGNPDNHVHPTTNPSTTASLTKHTLRIVPKYKAQKGVSHRNQNDVKRPLYQRNRSRSRDCFGTCRYSPARARARTHSIWFVPAPAGLYPSTSPATSELFRSESIDHSSGRVTTDWCPTRTRPTRHGSKIGSITSNRFFHSRRDRFRDLHTHCATFALASFIQCVFHDSKSNDRCHCPHHCTYRVQVL